MASIIKYSLIAIFGLTVLVGYSSACKEALCASIISKCLLIDACKCDVINCTCCKDCFQCLGSLFADCCECVDMCPKSVSKPAPLNATSHVEDLPDQFNDLFNALTDEHDAMGRWTAYTYTVHRDLTPFLSTPTQLQNVELGMVAKDGISRHTISAVNCTVAYMAQCMPWNKCKNSCRSMGASSYRWFHDGCCECVGPYCLNYGMNESRCLNCPKINGGTMDDEFEGSEEDIHTDKPAEADTTSTASSTEETRTTGGVEVPSGVNVAEKSVRKSLEGTTAVPKIAKKSVTNKVNAAKNGSTTTLDGASSVSARPDFSALVSPRSLTV